MSKTPPLQEDYDKLIETFAQQLWFLRERWEGIKALRDVNKSFFSVWIAYPRFFESVYRSFVYDFYIGVCRLVLDDTKRVESMMKLLKKPQKSKPEITDKTRAHQFALKEIQLIAQIKSNATLQKIKNQRDFLLAHQNSNLLFDETEAGLFRQRNNPSPEEVDLLMHDLDEMLTQMASCASFYPRTTPDMSIKHDIKEIFVILDKKRKAN